MATPRLVNVRDFNTSRFAQLADTSTANIGDILARAEAAVEAKIKRPLAPTAYSERFQPMSQIIYVKRRPILSVENVTRSYSAFGYGANVPASSYYVNGPAGYVEFVAPIRGMVVDIQYTAGFEVLPEDLKEAILIQAAYFAFQDLEIYGSGDAKAPGIRYLREDVEELIKPYQLTNLAYTR